jgi:6-phosphogluconate dehydrogenase
MVVPDGIPNDVGVIGLNSIGRNVVLRLLNQGFKLTAMAWDKSITQPPSENFIDSKVLLTSDISEFVASLRPPRKILIFGDESSFLSLILRSLLPHLCEGDLVIDAGVSFFQETAKSARDLAESGIHFAGIGLAGGERGARHGAVIMAGGERQALQKADQLLGALAATSKGESCINYFDTAASAHFVHMVHASVDFALLKLLTETFDVLQRTLLLTDEELLDTSMAWHIGLLNGYLAEISGCDYKPENQGTPGQTLRKKLERFQTSAMAQWAAQSARELEVLAPTLEAAAGSQRMGATALHESFCDNLFRQPIGQFGDDPESLLEEIHKAFQAAMIIIYAQAMALLAAASKNLGFQFQLHEISRAWRVSGRLRAALLDAITSALQVTPDLPGLLADDDLSERLMACQEKLRHAVWRACELDLPVPVLMASLDYLDSNKAAWLPVNLIHVPLRPSAKLSRWTERVF